MIEKVNRFIKKHELIKKGSTIIVGVSGGPDSLALLHYLFHHYKEVTLIAAHVDHMFRGKESEEDLLYVKDFCESFQIPFESIQIDVTSYKKEHGLSSQVAAREVRYEFFNEVMQKHKADYLALGHHGDDQIESILMRLVRGSKGIGYAGMQIKRPFSCGEIIRPFLSVTKADIEEYCREWRLSPRRDPSNEKDDYTRNRFRHHVLPFLKQENPAVHEHFLQFNQYMTEDNEVLDELTIEKMNKVMKRNEDNEIEIEIPPLLAMPKSLQRRGIQLILNYLYKELPPSLSAVHIDNLLTFLANNHPSGELHFPAGLRIVKSYESCTYTYTDRKENVSPYRFHIDTPGLYKLEDGSEIKSQVWKNYPNDLVGNDCFVIDPDNIQLPIYVRTRKIGDKMRLKGMNGSKKVKDIFIDEKIPLNRRDHWPIVEDEQGKILWLPGLKKSSYEASCKTKSHYIVLQYTQNV
ncbi:tRNA lysidine(34) synthetase TilS [Fredinandcohnia sp. QZ13]|uniref:tRNA lysidine(34) synthetase TilS n=1 Tax=Fredinandcohnia sp. QZ13 TaxID=3073144 RepID=UPI0028533635|nr:tRNA lysidine(34) synthetase TilS [Fredinandcohnia sp. QZ13]MDR4888524.1 tRNA lysidine(34) synthetase TilS [Fredinandcohnia sp. QZ13]